MRKNLIAILLLSAAFAVAQQPSTTTPSAPATGSQATPGQPSMPGSPATPGASSAGQTPMNNDDVNVIQGCLGGTAPNFTVTDKTGTTYKLDIPPGADASVLSKHIGESVQVQGNVSKGGATAGDTAATGKADSSIAVMRIGKGTGTCAGGAGMSKPQSDTTGSDKPQSDKPPTSEKPMSEQPPAGVPKPPTR